MLKRYLDYLKHPSTKNLRAFLEAVIDYDFQNYYSTQEQMLELYQKATQTDNVSVVFSNGSTGKNNQYHFGPNWQTCLEVENFLRGGSQQVFLCSFFPTLPTENSLQFLNINGKPAIKFDIKSKKNIANLVGYIKTLSAGTVIVAQPNIILYLSHDDEFIEGISESGVILTSVDWEGFYDRDRFKVRVNDQMIDWKSGVNFYTCSHNQLHFLPIFAQTTDRFYNLLNINNKEGSSKDDLVTIGNDIIHCQCGKNALKFEIIPHWQNCPIVNGKIFYDLGLAKQITEQVYNFQFLQKQEEEIIVVYSARGDKEINFPYPFIKKYLKNTTFCAGSRKYCTFWRGKHKLLTTKMGMFVK